MREVTINQCMHTQICGLRPIPSHPELNTTHRLRPDVSTAAHRLSNISSWGSFFVQNCNSDGRNWPVLTGVPKLTLCLGVLCTRDGVSGATSERSWVAYKNKNYYNDNNLKGQFGQKSDFSKIGYMKVDGPGEKLLFTRTKSDKNWPRNGVSNMQILHVLKTQYLG